MKIVQVKMLKEGDRFSRPVFIDGKNMFVSENVPLRIKELERLERWGITALHTEGELLPNNSGNPQADLSDSVSFVNYINTPIHREILDTYRNLTTRFREIQRNIEMQKPMDNGEIDKIVDTLFSVLADHRDDLIQLIFFGLPGESDSAQNALNCAVLSGIIGAGQNMIQHKLLQLATGALLHDVGMLRVPKEIVGKTGKLDQTEIGKIKAHTIHSYKIITRELKYPEEIGLIALQHHERWDGEGYPKKLSGRQISFFARIVAVADAFEAMVSDRPYRDSMIGYTAMRSILGDNGRRFDPEILRVFIKCMGIYPLGSIVLLSSSCVCRVVENNPEAPLRPKVKIMINKDGSMVENDRGEIIDLNISKKIFIARAVDPKSLAKTASE